MRLPTQPRARSVPPARRALRFALLALSLGAAPALATRWTVDIGGTADFTTIQAAIDQQGIEFRDTILVMPGEYAETITPPVLRTALVSTGGAAVTAMHSIVAAPYSEPGGYANIDGFTFTQAVSLIEHNANNYPFVHCAFLAGMNWQNHFYQHLPINDCDFYARTHLAQFYGSVSRLRFHAAPLFASSVPGGSHFLMEDCVFEGPADTLVHLPLLGDDGGHFNRCSFENAKKGIVYEGGSFVGFGVARSSFRDLSEAGIWLDDTTNYWHEYSGGPTLASLGVSDSRFERCGTAVHWTYWKPGLFGAGVFLARDTILASVGDGILLGPSGDVYAGIADCLIDGSGGRGAALIQNHQYIVNGLETFAGTLSTYTISRVQFTHNADDGLFIQDTIPRVMEPYNYPPPSRWRTRILGCLFANNGGNGARVEVPAWSADSCIAIGNGKDGLWLRGTALDFAIVATRNTSVFNHGDGLRFSARGSPPDSLFFIERNLAVINVGAGIRVPLNGGLRHFAYNDAWNNYLAQYIAPGAPGDSNLTVNPRFCNLGAGDLGLEQGSPCGPGGLYGLIGALPEWCPNTLAVEPTAGVGVAFAVRPSVARGSVEFVPPASGGEGEVELFDLAGRVVWHSPLGPATGAIRWRGEGDAGRVRPGLYWARFTRGDELTTKKLVWLE